MSAPIQFTHVPKRGENPYDKPATKRAFVLFIAAACFAVFCAGLIARCMPIV